MEGIPKALYSPLRETLKKCNEVFSNQQMLWSIFSSEEQLRPWLDNLPEASSLNQRVDLTIGYLVDKHWKNGESVLVIFLEVLTERYDVQDDRHEKLQTLVEQLRWFNQFRQRISPQTRATLEANPHGSQMLPIIEAERALLCARSVARVDLPQIRKGKKVGESTGTAWLLAPGLAITCWHVLESRKRLEPPIEVPDLQAQLENMLLTFDYTVAGKGVQYKVESDSLYPTIDTGFLDYALLRLHDRHDEPLARYKHLYLDSEAPLTTQSSLYIIQHPLGGVQQIAGDSFERISPTKGRILYHTPTEPGTSGAPVFNRVNWHVVALHNGENELAHLREGTLMQAILAELEQEKPDLYHEIMTAQNSEV